MFCFSSKKTIFDEVKGSKAAPFTMSDRDFTRLVRSKAGFSLAIVICAALIVESISILQYSRLRRLVMDGLARQSRTELWSKTEIINHTLESAEATLEEHLWDLRTSLPWPDSMFSATARLVENNPDIVGGFIAFVPDYYPGKGRLFEPYARKDGSSVVVSQLASPGHDYTANANFKRSLSEDRGIWTDPYLYVGESASRLTTYSRPLKDDAGRTVAICGIDIDLSWLGDTLNASHQFPSSFTLMLTKDGEPFAEPSSSHPRSADVGQVARLLGDSASPDGSPSDMTVFRDRLSGDKAFIYSSSREEDPRWRVAQVVFEKELYGRIRKMRLLDFFLSLAALFALFLIIERFVSNGRKLRDANMKQARIDNELGIARRIQEEMLPKVFPPFPDRYDIDIHGTLEPAKEVGGDLFDFFIRDGKLFFLIGDVSGKGIPAAMVMSMMHSLFSFVSAGNDDPVDIIEALNGEGCRNNESGMFVTCFLGVLELATGRLRYCNAGHDRPMLVSDAVEELPARANLPIGVFEDTTFEGQECTIAPGTTIFLYTDGVTEAKDASRRMFTKERLAGLLEGFTSGISPSGMTSAVGKEIHAFMGGAEQSDDLTMLAIRYNGPARHGDSITLRNDVRQVTELNSFVKSVTGRLGMSKGRADKLRLAVEEIAVNVMKYAYPEGSEGLLDVSARSDGSRLAFVVTDSGEPFDPTSVPPADTDQPADKRSPGGLGILLARSIADSIGYERKDGKNILTIGMDIK